MVLILDDTSEPVSLLRRKTGLENNLRIATALDHNNQISLRTSAVIPELPSKTNIMEESLLSII